MSRVVTEDELRRMRALARKRTAIAEKHGVAVGWVDAEGNVDPRAPKLRPQAPAKGRRR